MRRVPDGLDIGAADAFGESRTHDSGEYDVAEIAALFNNSRSTVYRSLERTAALSSLPAESRSARDLLHQHLAGAKYIKTTFTPFSDARQD